MPNLQGLQGLDEGSKAFRPRKGHHSDPAFRLGGDPCIRARL